MATRTASRRYTTTTTSTKRAMNEANQEALDRLQQRLEKQAPGSKQIHAIRKAIRAVAECETPITTRKQAMALKGIGDTFARIIVPEEAAAAASAPRQHDDMSTSSTHQRAPPPPAAARSNKQGSCKTEVTAKQVAHEKARQLATELVLPRKNWKVILLLDGREQERHNVIGDLQKSSVPCEIRHLPIGDMAWIARSGNVEVMLGTIVERKDVEDLKSSLFGSRYLEQRLRLQHCGIAQVLLLVEGNVNGVTNCPADTLRMAMMETRVQLEFQICQTRHLQETVSLLKSVHRRIVQRAFPDCFGSSHPTSLPSFVAPTERRRRDRIRKEKESLNDLVFDMPPVPPLGQDRFMTYNELKAKVEMDRENGTRTLSAVYGSMLKQIKSVSSKKAVAIQQEYPTMNAILSAYAAVEDDAEGEGLIANLSTNTTAERVCRVGPKSSTDVYRVFCANPTGSDSGSTHEPTMTAARAETTMATASATATTTAASSTHARERNSAFLSQQEGRIQAAAAAATRTEALAGNSHDDWDETQLQQALRASLSPEFLQGGTAKRQASASPPASSSGSSQDSSFGETPLLARMQQRAARKEGTARSAVKRSSSNEEASLSMSSLGKGRNKARKRGFHDCSPASGGAGGGDNEIIVLD